MGAGRWNLTIDPPDQGEPVVHLMLLSPGLNTITIPAGALRGLPFVDARSTASSVSFRLEEDAGTLYFDGQIDGKVGRGTFTFSPNARFAAELVRRGMQKPGASELFNLARHQVGLSVLDELEANGYETPSTVSFVNSGFHSIDTKYIRQMAELGYRLGTLDSLIMLRSRGVTPKYIRALARLGYTDLSTNKLMAMASQGVDERFIKSMNLRTARRLSPAELVLIRIRGSRT
ncbi:MAG TPA: hypothetical protein VF042_07405 [Gemmatimonadaceae bacterium]